MILYDFAALVYFDYIRLTCKKKLKVAQDEKSKRHFYIGIYEKTKDAFFSFFFVNKKMK